MPVSVPTETFDDGWAFFRYKDSPGGDIGVRTTPIQKFAVNRYQKLKEECLARGGVAFNTNGWIKHFVDLELLKRFTNKKREGLYVYQPRAAQAPPQSSKTPADGVPASRSNESDQDEDGEDLEDDDEDDDDEESSEDDEESESDDEHGIDSRGPVMPSVPRFRVRRPYLISTCLFIRTTPGDADELRGRSYVAGLWKNLLNIAAWSDYDMHIWYDPKSLQENFPRWPQCLRMFEHHPSVEFRPFPEWTKEFTERDGVDPGFFGTMVRFLSLAEVGRELIILRDLDSLLKKKDMDEIHKHVNDEDFRLHTYSCDHYQFKILAGAFAARGALMAPESLSQRRAAPWPNVATDIQEFCSRLMANPELIHKDDRVELSSPAPFSYFVDQVLLEERLLPMIPPSQRRVTDVCVEKAHKGRNVVISSSSRSELNGLWTRTSALKDNHPVFRRSAPSSTEKTHRPRKSKSVHKERPTHYELSFCKAAANGAFGGGGANGAGGSDDGESDEDEWHWEVHKVTLKRVKPPPKASLSRSRSRSVSQARVVEGTASSTRTGEGATASTSSVEGAIVSTNIAEGTASSTSVGVVASAASFGAGALHLNHQRAASAISAPSSTSVSSAQRSTSLSSATSSTSTSSAQSSNSIFPASSSSSTSSAQSSNSTSAAHISNSTSSAHISNSTSSTQSSNSTSSVQSNSASAAPISNSTSSSQSSNSTSSATSSASEASRSIFGVNSHEREIHPSCALSSMSSMSTESQEHTNSSSSRSHGVCPRDDDSRSVSSPTAALGALVHGKPQRSARMDTGTEDTDGKAHCEVVPSVSASVPPREKEHRQLVAIGRVNYEKSWYSDIRDVKVWEVRCRKVKTSNCGCSSKEVSFCVDLKMSSRMIRDEPCDKPKLCSFLRDQDEREYHKSRSAFNEWLFKCDKKQATVESWKEKRQERLLAESKVYGETHEHDLERFAEKEREFEKTVAALRAQNERLSLEKRTCMESLKREKSEHATLSRKYSILKAENREVKTRYNMLSMDRLAHGEPALSDAQIDAKRWKVLQTQNAIFTKRILRLEAENSKVARLEAQNAKLREIVRRHAREIGAIGVSRLSPCKGNMPLPRVTPHRPANAAVAAESENSSHPRDGDGDHVMDDESRTPLTTRSMSPSMPPAVDTSDVPASPLSSSSHIPAPLSPSDSHGSDRSPVFQTHTDLALRNHQDPTFSSDCSHVSKSPRSSKLFGVHSPITIGFELSGPRLPSASFSKENRSDFSNRTSTSTGAHSSSRGRLAARVAAGKRKIAEAQSESRAAAGERLSCSPDHVVFYKKKKQKTFHRSPNGSSVSNSAQETRTSPYTGSDTHELSSAQDTALPLCTPEEGMAHRDSAVSFERASSEATAQQSTSAQTLAQYIAQRAMQLPNEQPEPRNRSLSSDSSGSENGATVPESSNTLDIVQPRIAHGSQKEISKDQLSSPGDSQTGGGHSRRHGVGDRPSSQAKCVLAGAPSRLAAPHLRASIRVGIAPSRFQPPTFPVRPRLKRLS